MPEYFTFANVLLGLGMIFTLAGTMLTSIEANRQQGEYAKKLQKSTDEIIRLSNLNSSLITGGNAFPEIIAGFDGGYQSGLISIRVLNSSETPIYDLKIQITDQQAIDREMPNLTANGNFDELDSLRHFAEIGTLSPRQSTQLATVKYDVNLSHLRFSFESSARNGNFSQSLEFFKIGNEWLRATRIRHQSKEGQVEYLKDDIDRRIPKELLRTVN